MLGRRTTYDVRRTNHAQDSSTQIPLGVDPVEKLPRSRLRSNNNPLERILVTRFGEPVERLLFILQRWKVWADPVAHISRPLTVNGRRVHPKPLEGVRDKHRRRVHPEQRRIDVVTTRHMLKLHHFDQRARYRAQQTLP